MEYKTARRFVKEHRVFVWVSTVAVMTTLFVPPLAEALCRLLLSSVFSETLLFSLGLLLSVICPLLVTVPLLLGQKRGYMTGEGDTLFYFFKNFKRYLRAVFVGFLLLTRMTLYVLLTAAVPVGVYLFSRTLPPAYDFLVQTFHLLTLAATLLTLMLWIAQIVRYTAVLPLLAAHPTLPVRRAVKLSKQLTQGRALKKAFRLTPLFLLGVLVLPLLFILPFYDATRATCIKAHLQTE